MHSSNKSGNSDTSSVRLHDQVLEQWEMTLHLIKVPQCGITQLPTDCMHLQSCSDKAHRSQPALPRPAAMLKPLENV